MSSNNHECIPVPSTEEPKVSDAVNPRIQELESINAQLQDRLHKLLTFAQGNQAKYEEQVQQLMKQQREQEQGGAARGNPEATSHRRRSKGMPNKGNSSASSLHKKEHRASEHALPNLPPHVQAPPLSRSEPTPTAASRTSSQISFLSDSTTTSQVLAMKLDHIQQKTLALRASQETILQEVLQLHSQHVQSMREVSKDVSDRLLEEMLRSTHVASSTHQQEKEEEEGQHGKDWEHLYHTLKRESEQAQLNHERRLIRAKEQWQQRSEEQQQQTELYLKKVYEVEKNKLLLEGQEEGRKTKEELEALKEEYKKLRTQSRGITRRNEEYKEKLNIYESQIQQLTQTSDRCTDLQAQVELQKTITKDLQTQLAQAQAHLAQAHDHLEREQGAHQQSLQSTSNQADALLVKVEELTFQLQEAHSLLDEGNRRTTVLTEELNTSKALFASKSTEWDTLQVQLALTTKRHHDELQEKSQALYKAQAQVEQLRHAKEEVEKRLELRAKELHQQRTSTAETLQAQQDQCDQLAEALHTSKTEHQALMEHFQLLQSQLQETETSLNESQVMLHQLEQTKEHYTSLQALHEKLSFEFEKIEVREHQLKQINRSLQEEVKKLHLRHASQVSVQSTESPPHTPTATPTSSSESTFHVDYLKSVLFKFLSTNKQMRFQLIPVLNMLLQCNEEELNTLHTIARGSD